MQMKEDFISKILVALIIDNDRKYKNHLLDYQENTHLVLSLLRATYLLYFSCIILGNAQKTDGIIKDSSQFYYALRWLKLFFCLFIAISNPFLKLIIDMFKQTNVKLCNSINTQHIKV